MASLIILLWVQVVTILPPSNWSTIAKDATEENEEEKDLRVMYLNTHQAIDTSAGALLDLVSHHTQNNTTIVVLGLDAEWPVPVNSRGQVIGSPGKLSLIQIAHRLDGEEVRTVLYHLPRLKNLPPNLVALLMHTALRFAGVGISGDLRKINRDWGTDINVLSVAVECASNYGQAARHLASESQSRECHRSPAGL